MIPETMATFALSVRVLATSAKARQMTVEKAVDLHIVDLRLRAAKKNMRNLEATRSSMSKFERLLEDSLCCIRHLFGTRRPSSVQRKVSEVLLTIISLCPHIY